MTDSELTELLRDLESDRVERKASLSDRERIREAICAFANELPNHGKPGVIFVAAGGAFGYGSVPGGPSRLLRKNAD